MINIKNQVKKIKISTSKLRQTVQKILDVLNYSDYDIGILLTTNKTIHTYNLAYRSKDKSTDILSFSYHTELKAGDRIKPHTEDDKNLGDLIISLEYVQEDAKRYNQTFEERMKVLLVHGICHLLGYDHEKDSDYKKMHAKELAILRKLK